MHKNKQDGESDLYTSYELFKAKLICLWYDKSKLQKIY